MKIVQKSQFQPIVITLETQEEAIALWDTVQFTLGHLENKISFKARVLTTISDWFSHHIKF